MRTPWPALATSMALAAYALSACGSAPQLSVDHGYIRLAAVKRSPAAAYFTIHGGPSDTTLLSVSTDVAIKAEIHRSMMTGAMSSMTPLDTLPIPARGDVTFAPGALHVMLFDMNPGIKPGRLITLTFVFANGQRLVQKVPAIAAGAPAPES